ncbi:MAG: hypothetical protein J7647_31980, partial [Cyanobacteria bacterium SBLK]|nr:hypothetical protein [Cyanobacteria bacterium SBLK]
MPLFRDIQGNFYEIPDSLLKEYQLQEAPSRGGAIAQEVPVRAEASYNYAPPAAAYNYAPPANRAEASYNYAPPAAAYNYAPPANRAEASYNYAPP